MLVTLRNYLCCTYDPLLKSSLQLETLDCPLPPTPPDPPSNRKSVSIDK